MSRVTMIIRRRFYHRLPGYGLLIITVINYPAAQRDKNARELEAGERGNY